MDIPIPDDQLIDRIIYLASLASNRREIDPLMNNLRTVTANRQSGEPLTAQAKTTLTILEGQLQDYLIGRDPLRSFTKETLNQRLLAQQTGQDTRPAARRTFWAFIATAVGVGTIAMLPFYATFTTRLIIAVPLFYTVLTIGAVWFYLTSLQNFRPELRRAFLLLSGAVIVMTLEFSQAALVSLLGWGDLPPFRYAGFIWLVTISFILLYLGLRIYARMMQIKSFSLSLPAWLLITAIFSLGAVVAPHAAHVRDELFFDLSLASAVTLIITPVFGAVVARAIMNNVTTAFTGSIRWLFRYQVICIPGIVVGCTALYLLGQLNGQALNLEIEVFGLGPLLLLLYTGYSFKRDTGR